MHSRRQFLQWSSSAFTLAGLSEAHASVTTEPIAVVVASNVHLDALSFYELKRLYLGGKARSSGSGDLVPLNRGTPTLERVEFDRIVLRMSSEEAARYWIDRRIRGESGSPKAIDPSSVLQRVLTKLPGAIGYVLLSEVSPQVKAIRIDGKLPADPGYPILASLTSQTRSG